MMGQSNISNIEYFFDTDPGVGNATNVAVSSIPILNENVSVSINSLSSGIHILHMRSKNEANKWGLYGRQPFYIANFSAALNNTIIAAEYFIDTDPGTGNATVLNISSVSNLNTTFAIPLTSVATGIHILHIRVKNNLDQWGLYARQAFYKSPQILGNDIVAAEYFIDADPGVGNGKVLPISQGAQLNEFLSIPLTAVSEGIHILHIRVKNNSNQWGMYARQVFYKSPQILGNELIATEYFIDEDPGIGTATPIAITQSQSVDEVLNIAIPEDLEEGDHVLHLRVQRSDGKWSLYGRPEFKTSLSVGNLNFENFKIYPNPVNDILNVSLTNGTLEHIKIIDSTGKMVFEQTNNLQQLNVGNLATGMYLLQIKTSNGSISKKIIKQ
jgi:hypothetical protein